MDKEAREYFNKTFDSLANLNDNLHRLKDKLKDKPIVHVIDKSKL